MAMHMPLLVALIVSTVGVLGQQPPLPTLPSAFSTIVEANIENKGYTTTIHEWVDEDQNAGRLDVFYVHEGVYGHATTIYNYETSSYVHLNESGCVGGNLTDLPFRPFFGTPGQAGHIGSITNIFKFGGDIQETFNGTRTPHGIKANKWRSKIQTPVSNQTLDWYFTDNTAWTMPESEGQSVPLLLRLKGSRVDFANPSGGLVHYDHHYEFVSFHKLNGGFLGSYNTSVFKVPCGTVCTGSGFTEPEMDCSREPCGVMPIVQPEIPSAPPTTLVPQGEGLPALPESFSVIVQANIVNKNYTTTAHEYYSGPTKENKARIDQFFVKNGVFGRSSQVYDYDNGYIAHLEDGNCTTQSLKDQRFLPFGGEVGSAMHIGTTAEILEIGKRFNTTYIRPGHARGIKCDVYRSESIIDTANFTSNYTLLWYFSSTANWTMPSTAQNSSVPVRLHLTGTSTSAYGTRNVEHYYDFYNFRFDEGATMRFGESAFALPCGTKCTGVANVVLPERECPVDACPVRPDLPNDFVTRIEGNDATKNSSFYVEEFFSATQNRAKIEVFTTVGFTHNHTHTSIIYDYTLNEMVALNDSGCVATKLTDVSMLPFRGTADETQGRIESVTELFNFGDQYNDVYIGTAYVRNILCHQWRVFFYQDGSNATMDHFFSVPEWDLPVAGGVSVPVMTKVAGMYMLPGQSEGVELDIEYHYIGFHSADPSQLDRVFTVPCGTECTGDYTALPERHCHNDPTSDPTSTQTLITTTLPGTQVVPTSQSTPDTKPNQADTTSTTAATTTSSTPEAAKEKKSFSVLETSGISAGAGILGLLVGFLIAKCHSFCKGRKKASRYTVHDNEDL